MEKELKFGSVEWQDMMAEKVARKIVLGQELDAYDEAFLDVQAMQKKDSGKYVDEDGIVRWDTNKKYSKQELAIQRAEFSKAAESGQKVCISDLMINAGM